MYKNEKNANDKIKKCIKNKNTFALWNGDDLNMIKEIAWNTFKNTGDINTFLELVEFENIEKNVSEAEKQNGNIKGEGNCNIRT